MKTKKQKYEYRILIDLFDDDYYSFQFESNSIIDTEHESQRLGLLENELKFLKSKYDDACVRITTGTQQLESLQIAFEQTSRRCEQLEEEKV